MNFRFCILLYSIYILFIYTVFDYDKKRRAEMRALSAIPLYGILGTYTTLVAVCVARVPELASYKISAIFVISARRLIARVPEFAVARAGIPLLVVVASKWFLLWLRL